MIIYIGCILFILFCRLFYNKRPSYSGKKIIVTLSMFPIFILLAMKNVAIGSDTINYIRMFNAAKYSVLEYKYERLEIGYKLFLNLITKIFSNPQWQFIIVAAFLVIATGIFVYRYSKEPTLAIIFYITLGIFSFNLTGIRQSIAMAICLFSYKYIKEKQLAKFIITIIFAMMFHKSAVFFIPAYFFAYRNINTVNILINILGAIVILMFSKPIMIASSSIFEIKYGIEKSEGGMIFLLIVCIITMLSFIFKKNILKGNADNIIFINLNMISMIFWCMRLISRTAERPSLYYLFATIILFEEILMSFNRKRERLLLIFISVVLVCVLFTYRLYGSPIYPYSFYWSP